MKAEKKNKNSMKGLKHIIIALLALTFLSSCDDWLYLEPADGVITDEFWQSESDLFAGLMGCYASMLDGGSGKYNVAELMFLWGEIRADMITGYIGETTDYALLSQGDIEPDNGFCKWGSFYTTINYCNTVLEKAPDIISLDASFTQDELKQYQAEALTIRALMYYYLTRIYRDVPLILKASSSDLQDYSVAKSSYDEIWKQIETDLLQAEADICYSYNMTKNEDKGRITKYTVWAILADFYLWTEQYEISEEYSDKIINSGKFWLVERSMELFDNLYENENSCESIFELQFDVDIPNPMYSMCITNYNYRAHPDVMEIFWPTDELLADADSADLRSNKGSYHSSYNYVIWKFYGKSRTARRSNTAQETDFNWIVYRYADVLLMKAEAMAAQMTSGDELVAEEVMSYITKIRNRSNASYLTDQGSPTTRDGLLYYILNERAREFAFEGKRWFDMLRYAKRDNYAKLSELKNMYATFASTDKLSSIQSKLNSTDFHYLPLPENDVLNSGGALVQNPFYE